jgi:hypothetical protein
MGRGTSKTVSSLEDLNVCSPIPNLRISNKIKLI